jgi:hypothetical protein
MENVEMRLFVKKRKIAPEVSKIKEIVKWKKSMK